MDDKVMDDTYYTIVHCKTLTGKTYEHLTTAKTFGEFLSSAELSHDERISCAMINGKRLGRSILLSSCLMDYAVDDIVIMYLVGLSNFDCFLCNLIELWNIGIDLGIVMQQEDIFLLEEFGKNISTNGCSDPYCGCRGPSMDNNTPSNMLIIVYEPGSYRGYNAVAYKHHIENGGADPILREKPCVDFVQRISRLCPGKGLLVEHW